ncbi:MAG: TetR/AcrR family transcriptional regulator [Syntrophobacter sp.]
MITRNSVSKPTTYSKKIKYRKRIVSGARRLFFSHGLRAVTMDELATELRVSKKTLYANFPNKVALVEAALFEKFQEIEVELEAITPPSEADLTASLQLLLTCFQRHMAEIHPPFLRDIQRKEPGMFEVVETRRCALIQRYLGRFFFEGRRVGVIRNDIPTEIIMEILLRTTDIITNPPKKTELRKTPQSLLLSVIRVLLEGALTDQGRSRL